MFMTKAWLNVQIYDRHKTGATELHIPRRTIDLICIPHSGTACAFSKFTL